MEMHADAVLSRFAGALLCLCLCRQGEVPRKRSRKEYGKRKDTKRAIVTISEESRPIEIFGAPTS